MSQVFCKESWLSGDGRPDYLFAQSTTDKYYYINVDEYIAKGRISYVRATTGNGYSRVGQGVLSCALIDFSRRVDAYRAKATDYFSLSDTSHSSNTSKRTTEQIADSLYLSKDRVYKYRGKPFAFNFKTECWTYVSASELTIGKLVFITKVVNLDLSCNKIVRLNIDIKIKTKMKENKMKTTPLTYDTTKTRYIEIKFITSSSSYAKVSDKLFKKLKVGTKISVYDEDRDTYMLCDIKAKLAKELSAELNTAKSEAKYWAVDIVDTSFIEELKDDAERRELEKARADEIKAILSTKVKALEQRQLFETLANTDPDVASLLKELDKLKV